METPQSDNELLKRFSKSGDENAFSEFVSRHLNLVYSVALRVLNGDRQLAEDVSQQVFADAAQKASKLTSHQTVTAWLFVSARYAASKLARSRIRQAQREQSAATMTEIENSTSQEKLEPELSPLIDEAIEKLPDIDRNAILLRFHEQLSYKAIGVQLGMPSNTARMRVERALPKLQAILSKRGVTSTGIALSSTLNSHAITPAPAGLSVSVAANAVSAAASSSTGFIALLSTVKGPLSTTAAIVAGGLILQFNLVQDPTPQLSEAHKSPHPQFAQPSVSHISHNQSTEERDPIELAYAALDRDAELLSARLSQINSQKTSRSSKTRRKSKVYPIADLDIKPRTTSRVAPVYPSSFYSTGVSGEALVVFTIDENGVPWDIEILEATHPEFASSALESTFESQFSPGEIAGEAVATQIRLRIQFAATKSEKPPVEEWF